MNSIRKLRYLIFTLYKWLPPYFINQVRNNTNREPVHILFCMTDHYEPRNQNVTVALVDNFPKLANKHRDFYGNNFKRTWFFPPHHHKMFNLKRLVSLCAQGFGEIELHIHHGNTCPDTELNFEETLIQALNEYSQFGIFGEKDNNKKYGFIHGNFALANSRGGKWCGINNELKILIRTGCYADFTFPSGTEADPLMPNNIFYASRKSDGFLSHKAGILVKRGSGKREGLMIVQGPLYPIFIDNKISKLRYMGDAIDRNTWLSEKRIDRWVETGIHVRGKREWIIIKTHTHGALNNDIVCGPVMDKILNYLETKFNDGKKYILHYVTARELYNIIRAVESEKVIEANPEHYRNYEISAPKYDLEVDIKESSSRLQHLIGKTYA